MDQTFEDYLREHIEKGVTEFHIRAVDDYGRIKFSVRPLFSEANTVPTYHVMKDDLYKEKD